MKTEPSLRNNWERRSNWTPRATSIDGQLMNCSITQIWKGTSVKKTPGHSIMRHDDIDKFKSEWENYIHKETRLPEQFNNNWCFVTNSRRNWRTFTMPSWKAPGRESRAECLKQETHFKTCSPTLTKIKSWLYSDYLILITLIKLVNLCMRTR